MLNEFYKSIDEVLMGDLELSLKLKLLRDLLKKSLVIDVFRLSCVERVLDTVDSWNNSHKPWNAPPIFYHDQLNYSVRIIFWPAFYENNPHQHKTWGVTGVFHNSLNINTYQMLDNPRRLKKERAITAMMGEVGYLVPGSIHNVSNPSHNLSASIHVFNNISDIDHPEENAIWYPSPSKHNLINGFMDRALMTCLSLVENIKHKRAFNIVDRIYARSSLLVKLMAVQSFYRFDRIYARQRFNELESVL